LDYFSIKDEAIGMSVCDICGEEQRHRMHPDDLDDMRRHLSTNHTAIYNEIRYTAVIHWESHFERVQCSTDSINDNIKCEHCNEYNDILLQVWKERTMESHLKVDHNPDNKNTSKVRLWDIMPVIPRS